MACSLTEQDLWSGIDRNAPEVEEHIARCPVCRERAEQFRAGIAAVAHAATPATPPVPTRIGPYTIHRRLGEGGMGIVYEGEQHSPNRLVAIKVVRAGYAADPYRVRLFQREAQTLARLRHAAIAAVHEAGCTTDGQHYFAMEHVRGTPLTDYVRDNSVPRRQRLALFRQICGAINYAHQRGVIHRDLKPTNILIDADGNPKILDFGLARITDGDAARTTVTDLGRIMGTLPYMSPEEARGHVDEMDVRSDIYSLGVILYELLTDRLPHMVRRTALPEAVRTICEAAPPRPRSIDRTIPSDLETIVLKALEKDPARRYQTAAELADDIERYQTNRAIVARRSSAVYHVWKFLLRNRLFVTLAIIAALYALGVRGFIEYLEKDRQAAIARRSDLQDLEKAVIEHNFASTLLESQRFDEAEPHYRDALQVYRRLGREGRMAPVLIDLAELLTQRTLNAHEGEEQPEFTDSEVTLLVEAESLLNEALAVLGKTPRATEPQRRRALGWLRILYGPRVWDEPQNLQYVEETLAALDAPPLPRPQ